MPLRTVLCLGVWLLAAPGPILRAQETLPHDSLEKYVLEVKSGIPAAGSERFVAPTEREMATFAGSILRILEGDIDAALTGARACGYELCYLHDESHDKVYMVARETEDRPRGLGTFIVNLDYDRNVIVAVPHPRYDLNTPGQGRKVFEGLGARALYIAGTHRCANREASPCSGKTGACTDTRGAYRISDAAHFSRTFLQAAHAAALKLESAPVALSLHGMSSKEVDVVLSDGTRAPAASGALVIRLRDRLVSRGVPVACCNRPEDSRQALCGTTNVQGRLYNGSEDPCGTRATRAAGRFLHLEQSRGIRRDPSRLIEALKAVLPVERPSPGTAPQPPALDAARPPD